MSPQFVPAIELNRRFYAEVVGPRLAGFSHAAGLLGYGSDVLGFDTERSTDHGWGPRLVVLVDKADVDAALASVEPALPETFEDWPVGYDRDGNPGPHQVTVTTLRRFVRGWIGCDALEGMSTVDWLATPQQLLLGVVRGAVYHDGPGDLTRLRRELAWFPTDVARWMIACQWRRIEQEEAFVGRTSQVGDELGSRIVAARLVRELMRLHFLLCGEYWPYTKWFGSAYRALPDSDVLLPCFEAALAAPDFPAREDALVAAYETLANMHNATGLTDHVDPTVRQFYTRPFRVIAGHRFAEACLARVHDDWLRALPLVGSIDQYVDGTDVLSNPGAARAAPGDLRRNLRPHAASRPSPRRPLAPHQPHGPQFATSSTRANEEAIACARPDIGRCGPAS